MVNNDTGKTQAFKRITGPMVKQPYYTAKEMDGMSDALLECAAVENLPKEVFMLISNVITAAKNRTK